MSSFHSSIVTFQKRVHDIIASEMDTPNAVLEVLNQVLAAERACVERYLYEFKLAQSVHGDAAAASFSEFAADEQRHVDLVAERITALGGQVPPATEASAPGTDQEPDLSDLVTEDIRAEQLIAKTYEELVGWLEPRDPASATMLAEILADELQHADVPEQSAAKH